MSGCYRCEALDSRLADASYKIDELQAELIESNAKVDKLKQTIKQAMNEIGVPTPDYPSPFVYAYDALKTAMNGKK